MKEYTTYLFATKPKLKLNGRQLDEFLGEFGRVWQDTVLEKYVGVETMTEMLYV